MNDYKIFNQFKDKIKNTDNLNDAIHLFENAKLQTNNKNEQLLLKSLIVPEKYNSSMNINKFKLYLDIVDFIYYKEDAEIILSDIISNNHDSAQIKTLMRMLKNKPLKNYSTYNDYKTIYCKNCPHCGKKNTGNMNTIYIICGYNNKGFDWKGCGHDWCFKCGKKLCKNWANNKLFNKLNRVHDGKCCRHYALSIGEIYEENFCQCEHNMRYIL